MKKIITATKAMLLAAVVFVVAQGCIPTPTGGYPEPTCNHSFTVNITSQIAMNSLTPYVNKYVVVDGDSINFELTTHAYNPFPDPNIIYSDEDMNVVFPVTAGYEYVALSDSFQLILYNDHIWGNGPAVLDKNMTINSILPSSIYVWKSLVVGAPANFTLRDYSWDTESIYNFPVNQDKYIVFRKLTGTQYTYYSLNIKREGTEPISVGNKFSIFSCCYNLNSITTGL